ncbi:MAG: 4-hydroxy-3-methylbut-2-enyl diphosphate reductase [Clostridiales bacterium]|nr:4-hydroxy-3-methylbut-2-enyl diphosphate reductase [Clostridiales bacterium]
MNYELCPRSGFCFGVSRAVSAAKELAAAKKSGERLLLLEQLIHNHLVMEELQRLGAEIVMPDELDRIYRESAEADRLTVVIRAHGIEKALYEKLRRLEEADPRFHVYDGTCPEVSRIHKIVDENTAAAGGGIKKPLLVIGSPGHPEVRAIMSYAHGAAVAANSLGELEELLRHKKFTNDGFMTDREGKDDLSDTDADILVVAQTTQMLTEWKKCRKFIKNLYTNAIIFDTICRVTELRQNEVELLSRRADLMVIIGDKSSSNTAKLYEISKKNCKTVFVDGAGAAAELHVPCGTKVGIAAGASTPGGIIEEVIRTMEQNENINASMNEEKGMAVTEENFEQMLEESLKPLTTGETVNGIITSISANELHVDLASKCTGIIPISEITDESGANLEEMFNVGDEIEAIVVKVSDVDGVATLSRKRVENIINWRRIVAAYNEQTTIEGKIVEVVKSGVIILLESVRVFIPASQSGVPRDGDLATLVGTTQRVKIIDLNEQRRRAVASIRAVIREERKAVEAEFWANIEKGKQYQGVVKSFMPYGAFVDLGGVDGMVHCSELSWKRIKHPSDIVSLGETIDVYVKDFDPDRRRISLGYKTEESNPWNIFIEKYKKGDLARVKIVNLMPFGAFAEVVPGTDGLIHISQITDHKIAHPGEVLSLGQEVDAIITDIEEDRQRISLSIRALLESDGSGAPEAAQDEASETVFETVEEITEEPAEEAVEEAPVEAAEEPAEETVEEAPVETAEEPAEEAVEEAPVEAAEEPAEEAVEEAPVETAEESAEEAVEEAPVETTEEPAEEAVEAAEEPAESDDNSDS